MASDLAVDEIMAILPDTPGRIAAITNGLTASQLGRPPHPGAWSVNDILAHLRACHDVIGGSLLRVMAEDRPHWRVLSPRTWIKHTDYPDWEFKPALAAFSRQRAELLAVLEPLPPEAWERFAVVTGQAGTFERSARYYGDWMAGHEQVHLRQLPRLVDAVRGNGARSVR